MAQGEQSLSGLNEKVTEARLSKEGKNVGKNSLRYNRLNCGPLLAQTSKTLINLCGVLSVKRQIVKKTFKQKFKSR